MSHQRKDSSSVTQPSTTATAAPARGLRVADAARYAGVSHWFIRTAVWTGKLRAYRAGKVIVILRDDLDRWLNTLPEVVPNNSKWLAKRQQAAMVQR